MFLRATLPASPGRRAAVRLLEAIARGDEAAATAALTVDEVVWVAAKARGRDEAIAIAEDMVRMPNLRLLDVRAIDVDRALGLMRDHAQLAPRDAIHAAVALNAGIFTIVSNDADFDAVHELDRRSLR